MKQTNKQLIAVTVLVLAGFGLMALPKAFEKPEKVTFFRNTAIECLPNGHANIGQHIHQDLSITVGGLPIAIPANVGIEGACMSEVHTHDMTGKIHVETVEPGKKFTLSDFFIVWGEPIAKDGYRLEATLDGVAVADPAGIVLEDGQSISLSYVK